MEPCDPLNSNTLRRHANHHVSRHVNDVLSLSVSLSLSLFHGSWCGEQWAGDDDDDGGSGVHHPSPVAAAGSQTDRQAGRQAGRQTWLPHQIVRTRRRRRLGVTALEADTDLAKGSQTQRGHCLHCAAAHVT